MASRGLLTFSLREFAEGVTERRCSVAAKALDLEGAGVDFRGPVEVDLRIARTREEFHVRGEARVAIGQVCSRCLEPIEMTLRAPVSVLVRPHDSREREGEEPPDGLLYHDGDVFSVAEEVREMILLEIPSHALCRPDCRGLCPRCGENRNTGACRCPGDEGGDPRWSALRSLRAHSDEDAG